MIEYTFYCKKCKKQKSILKEHGLELKTPVCDKCNIIMSQDFSKKNQGIIIKPHMRAV